MVVLSDPSVNLLLMKTPVSKDDVPLKQALLNSWVNVGGMVGINGKRASAWNPYIWFVPKTS